MAAPGLPKVPPGSSVLGRRCAMGCETWPNTDDYLTCPKCGEPTRVGRDAVPLEPDVARGLLRQAQFERWLEEHGRL